MARYKIFRAAYILPGLHLSACLTGCAGYIVPKLSFLGIIFTFVLIADLPISFVTYAAAWKYGLFAATWTLVVGTLWWYGLGRAAEYVIEWIKDSRGDQSGSLFPPDKRS